MNPKQRHLFRLSILTIYCSFFFHHWTLVSASNASAPYTPTDVILLSTGSSGNSTADDGRAWTGDNGSKFAPFPQSKEATLADQRSAIGVPYSTARFSRSRFTYTFPVTDGPKFVRLYFYPISYSELEESKALFSVGSGPYTLLANFSGYLTAEGPNASREFCINVEKEDQVLHVTFTPSSSNDSYAFVNGIEIFSMPLNLYDAAEDREVPYVGQITNYQIESSTALETVYRLNVGGPSIKATDDSGLFRVWSFDDPYVKGESATDSSPPGVRIKYTEDTPAYVAPQEVYLTSRSLGRNRVRNRQNNLTWILPVDLGFMYLVRLHFCETLPEIVDVSDRQFTIYIDSQMVVEAFDVIAWSKGNGIPVFKDYAVRIESNGSKGKYDLPIDLGTRPGYSKYVDAVLNGIEIFKLNKTDGTLAGQNPEPPNTQPSLPATKKSTNKKTMIIAIGAAVMVGLVLLSLLLYIIFRPRRKTRYYNSYSRKSWWLWYWCWGQGKSKSSRTKASSLPEELCLQFPLAEIKEATNNFHESCIIGKGGFGNVYKGNISDLDNAVAIKRLNPMSRQGAHEFKTEIEMLSSLRHGHLVSLIGYCNEGREMILVYEFMNKGTLGDHLYETNNDPLRWRQRLKICIDAARGLDYLHTGAPQKVIHRDVKTTNILLDDKWIAKVSDFGLSKIGPTSMPVETMVKGTRGYLDPEYYRRGQLTEKCDVYSFGVVLLEVLCARKPLNPRLGTDEANLAHWAKFCIQKGTFDQIIDPYLIGKISPACLKKFVEIAMSCVQDQGTDRPMMADVVDNLEFALRLQESAEKAEGTIVDPVVLYRDVSFSSAITGTSNDLESGVAADSSASGCTGTGTTTSDCTTSKATNSSGV
ncbi:receptor-like protein kinase FERONIA [Vitis riparia]|uniref:receptor-like protein kinase FERONIA n=1 Tax=Vitis riparia TaxID=96939 RepID=UPI00155A720D|nr:receptor-like protein kinase FERONIA [Vitis riparia]